MDEPASQPIPQRPTLSFREFIAQVNPRYQFYRHCEELISVLQRVADGELSRVMVFMPPRHGKSEAVSRLFSAYYLYRYPERFVGIASYGADLAYTLSRAAREHYQSGGGQLHKASKSVKHWQTSTGGGLWAAGVGGPMTGKGFQLGIIDDPLKDAEQAASSAIRAKQEDWYGSTWATRMEPGAAVVIVQTRWHEADLSGYLLGLEAEEPENWYIVSMPAIAEDVPPELPSSCTLHPDWREHETALCEERYPLVRLRKVAKRLGEYFFSALFQQRPRPRSGGMFPRDKWNLVQVVPAGATRVRYWDTAGAKPGKGDWTVGLLLASVHGRWIVEDVVRGQWPAAERNRIIRQTAAQDAAQYQRVPTYVEQPPGLAKESTDAIILALAGFPAYADPVSGDKVSRAEPFAAQVQAGNVDVLIAAWNRAFFDEYEAFPNAPHDDQVDTGSGAFQKLLTVKPPRIAPGGVGQTSKWQEGGG